jgi:hypothetical protein
MLVANRSAAMNQGMSRKRRLAAVVVALAAGWAASVANADVLKLAPSDALGVVRVKNLEGVSKKLADLSNKLGLAAMSPEMADPLGSALNEADIKAGLNKAGDLGVILLPAAAWPKDDGMAESKPAVVLLVPVSDYAAFLTNFKDAKTEGGITEFTKDGETQFVSDWGGGYAAMAQTKEHLGMKGNGVTVNAAAAKELASKDVVVWANVPELNKALAPKLAEERPKILDKAEEELKNNPDTAKYAGVARAAAGQFLTAAETFLSNAQGATLTFDIGETGINTSVAAEFAADSYLGKFASGLKGKSTASLTTGLPVAPYIVFGGGALNGGTIGGLVKDLAGPILAEVAKVEGAGEAAGQFDKLMGSMDKLMASAEMTSFAMYAPRAPIGTESLFQFATFVRGDAKAYMDGMKQYGEVSAVMAKLMAGGATPMTTEYKAANRTLDGITFDSILMSPKKDPTPEEVPMVQMMTMMYGPSGMSSDFGMVDEKTVVAGTGLNDANLSALIAAAKAGGDPIGAKANVKSTAAALPENPSVVFYFALDELIRTGVMYAQQFGLPVPAPQIPEDLPPIGGALTADGTTIRVDGHVPTELMQSISAAIIQMQMQRGGGGGGGGGL